MSIDLRGTIERLGKDKTVRRPGSTTYVQGFPQHGPEESRIVRMVVRPAKAEEVVRLKEGDRVQGAVSFWSTTPLAVTSVDGAQPGDVIEHEGADWEVRETNPSEDQGRYYSGLAVRRGR